MYTKILIVITIFIIVGHCHLNDDVNNRFNQQLNKIQDNHGNKIFENRVNNDVNNWFNQQLNKIQDNDSNKLFKNRINDDINNEINKIVDNVQNNEHYRNLDKNAFGPIVLGFIVFLLFTRCICR